MKYNLFLPTGFGSDFTDFKDPVEAAERVIELARTAEKSGFSEVWLPDHLQTIPPSNGHLFAELATAMKDASICGLGQTAVTATESAVDLCRLAGLPPVGVIAEIVEDGGDVMRMPGLRRQAHPARGQRPRYLNAQPWNCSTLELHRQR